MGGGVLKIPEPRIFGGDTWSPGQGQERLGPRSSIATCNRREGTPSSHADFPRSSRLAAQLPNTWLAAQDVEAFSGNPGCEFNGNAHTGCDKQLTDTLLHRPVV